MRALSALIIFPLIFSVTSCKKWEKKKDAFFYYSTDFKSDYLKSGNETILNININEIDILYTVFFHESKVWKYKLVAESSELQNSSNKSNEVLAYQEGKVIVDENLNILFIPDSNPSNSYSGYFENDKNNFMVVLPGINIREINFLKK